LFGDSPSTSTFIDDRIATDRLITRTDTEPLSSASMHGGAKIRAVQVDADELRVAARVLRDDAAEGLRAAADRVRVPEREYGVEAAFDRYTTAAAYQRFAAAFQEEFRLLEQAARELADALERTALDYQRSDERAAHRLGGGRR
jgi:hypothetical protein